ncbi:hypothetical protein GGR57DRAFT_503613 [Xylariaceae sp. FL1272]|nr:hypothetical protein GGR57DRAFT_503613 [Xylariaceae sp. FL1272]
MASIEAQMSAVVEACRYQQPYQQPYLPPQLPALPDFYQDLGATPLDDASALLEALYQKLRATHPDIAVFNVAADRQDFRRARAAYDYLSDPQRKHVYDIGYPKLQEQWQRYYSKVPSARPKRRPKPESKEKRDPRKDFDAKLAKYDRRIAEFENHIKIAESQLSQGVSPDHPQYVGLHTLHKERGGMKKISAQLKKEFKTLPTEDPALEGALGLRKYHRFR